MNRNFFRFEFVFLASLLLLSACQSRHSDVFSVQCAAPCWRNIEPGKTHFQDAVDNIKKFPDYEIKGAAINGSWNVFSNVMDFGLTSGEDISVFAIDNVVALITFHNPQSIGFEKCIEASDSSVNVIQTKYSGGDAIQRWFFAVSPSKGISCGFETNANFTLKPDINVEKINFFNPLEYQKLYDAQQLIIGNSDSYPTQEQFYKWAGYGNIAELYPQK